MATTLNPEQMNEVALGLTRNYEFRDLYQYYRNQFPTSIYYPSAYSNVRTFIYEHILSGYPLATVDDATAILALYDRTYGQDYLYELFPLQVHAFDTDEVLKGFFRAVADLRQYLVDLTKGLPALNNPFECPEEFLGWLGGLVGIDVPYELPLILKRLRIARAVPWYKIKGTHDSFRIALLSLGLDADIIELWSDYPGLNYSEIPDVYPVLPNGDPNPAYDPDNITDGLIKYKTSYFDIILGIIVDSIPSDIIKLILASIEEVRPITRTLRNIALGKFMEDTFEPPTDEVEASANMRLKDKYPFSSLTGTCLDYSCGAPEFALYDGLSPYIFDGTIDYGTEIPICTVFYDNAEEGFFDNVMIADYSGLLDSQGMPFLYSGIYNATLTYGECQEKDELQIDMAMSIIDDFWTNLGFLTYSHLDIFFDGSEGYVYDNIGGPTDDLEIGMAYSNEDTVTFDDDADFEALFDLEDIFLSAITYDGEEGYKYDMDCHTYGEAIIDIYDGTYLFDGATYYTSSGLPNFDGTIGWTYDCNPELYFDNLSYMADELAIEFSDFGPEDTFDTPTDDLQVAMGLEDEDNFTLPTDDLTVEFVEELFDYFMNPYIYDGTILYDGGIELFGGWGLVYDGSNTFGSFGTYAGSPFEYDGTLFYDAPSGDTYGGAFYDDELELTISSVENEDSVAMDDEISIEMTSAEDDDTFALPTDDHEMELESLLEDIFYPGVIFYDGSIDFDTGSELYDIRPMVDSLDIELSGTEEDSLPSDDEFSSESEANFEDTVTVSDDVEQVILVEDAGDEFGEPYLYGDGYLTYSSETNIILGGDSYNIAPTYNGFALPVYDELVIEQINVNLRKWDDLGELWDSGKWDE